MKRITIAALFSLLAALLLVDAAAANDNLRPAPKPGVTLSGTVSNDGKMLTADDDNNWMVINSDALKGFEKRYITVKCRMEPDKRAIRVFSVVDAKDHQQHLGDSAFRK